MVLAFYVGRLSPAAGDAAPFLRIPIVPGFVQLSFSPQTMVALAAIWVLPVHLRGVGPGRLVGNVLATLKVAAFVVFIAFGFSFGTGTLAHVAEPGPWTSTGWLLALIPVLFTYSGWNAAAYVAEEIRDPGRTCEGARQLGQRPSLPSTC